MAEVRSVKLLIDINVLLDMALDRHPWADDTEALLAEIEKGRASGFIAAHTITTIHYIVARAENAAVASGTVSGFLRLLDVVPVDRADLQQALAMGFRDFEDAVQGVCAMKAGVDAIISRDVRDFAGFRIPVADAAGILSLLDS